MKSIKSVMKKFSILLFIISLIWTITPISILSDTEIVFAAINDSDKDGISDEMELWIAKTFSPMIYFDKNERNKTEKMRSFDPARDVKFYYQVYKASCGNPKAPYAMRIVATYPYDFLPISYLGYKDPLVHYGDTERIIICIAELTQNKWPPNKRYVSYFGNNYWVSGLQIDRHGDKGEWTSGDKLEFWLNEPVLYVSEGKHAFYTSISRCKDYCKKKFGINWWCENCSKGKFIGVRDYISASNNVGETNKRNLKINPAFYNKRQEYIWDSNSPYCGGVFVENPNGKHNLIPKADLGDWTESPWCGGSLGKKWWPN